VAVRSPVLGWRPAARMRHPRRPRRFPTTGRDRHRGEDARVARHTTVSSRRRRRSSRSWPSSTRSSGSSRQGRGPRLIAVQMLNTERRAAAAWVNASLHVVHRRAQTGKMTVAWIIGRLYGASASSAGPHGRGLAGGPCRGPCRPTAMKVRPRSAGGRWRPVHRRAYAVDGGQRRVRRRAIAQLVKPMEDHRDDLAVIAGGLPRDEAVHRLNPGLRSRFTHYASTSRTTPRPSCRGVRGDGPRRPGPARSGRDGRLGHLFLVASDIGNFGNVRYARSCSNSPTRTWPRALGRDHRARRGRRAREEDSHRPRRRVRDRRIGFRPR
jgi:hypothetical protein